MGKLPIMYSCPLPAIWARAQLRHKGLAWEGARLWVWICIHQSEAEMKSQGSPQLYGGQDSVLSFLVKTVDYG